MSFPILTTKFYIPTPRPTLVDRPYLLQRMNAGLSARLTLISAPAGSGKSTLVSQWIAQTGRAAAWLSLDEGESDPSRFLVYLLGALQTVDEHLGQGLSALLDAPQPPPLESILTALLNQLATVSQEVILILDDYHAVDSQAVDSALTFLIEHLPPHIHLVIISREDPQIPLSRLRARGQLTEVRTADLRFNSAEATAFLNQMMGLDLAEEEVAALESRTEGWAAGLQLAALSLQGQEKQAEAEFVRAFAGDNRYIVDYLVDEVLDRQPPSVRGFLLQTAILRRLIGPLCDAVTGGTDGAGMLESLERANLFVVPLDDSRRWYRYHHLFGDVLRAHLGKAQTEEMIALHCRASCWYWENDFPDEALHHALAAPDYEQAARLLELLWPTMERSRQSTRWLGWIRTVPVEIVQARPVLCAGYGWALLDQGELEASNGWLDAAERWLAQADDHAPDLASVPIGAVVADAAQYRTLPAVIASARAYLSLAFGDRTATVDHAQRALVLLSPNDYLLRGSPAALLGLAFWASGRLEEAARALTEALGSFEKAGNLLFAITGVYGLADIRLSLGRRRTAQATYEDALQMARGGALPVLWGTADIYTGLGEFYCEQNELEKATEHLQRSKDIGEEAGFPRWRFRWSVAQARLKTAQGDLDSALGLLDEADRHFVRGPMPEVRPIAARKARLWLAQGHLSPAWQWAAAETLTPEDDLSFLQEYGHITLARLLLTESRQDGAVRSMQKALKLLQRLLWAAQAGSRQASVVEISLLLALTHAAQSDTPAALPHLQRALVLAEPEGYVRLFLDEGPPLARLLAEDSVRKLAPGYTGRLLAAFDSPLALSTAQTAGTPIPAPAPSSPLIEPLSDRELEVLGMIAEGLSNHEICARLYLALSTVKGHNRNIFGKLHVQRRTEAVARARELGLL